MSLIYDGGSDMKLLLIGLFIGFAGGVYLGISLVHLTYETAASQFMVGLGVGTGAVLGLMLMIGLLRITDRLLAQQGRKEGHRPKPSDMSKGAEDAKA